MRPAFFVGTGLAWNAFIASSGSRLPKRSPQIARRGSNNARITGAADTIRRAHLMSVRDRGLPANLPPPSVDLMADRLSELARQRALLAEHLAWIDREIAEETVKRLVPKSSELPSPQVDPDAKARVAPSTATTLPQAPSLPQSVAGAVAPEPTEILDQFRVTPAAVKQDVRKGCLLYFAAAFVVLGIVVAILYFSIGTRGVE
jgi:hypothetical protein